MVEPLEGQQEWCRRPRKLQKNDCEENERGARSEKNVRCGHTGEKKTRTAKPTMARCLQERHDRSGSERGQHDKQGRMEEEANQEYRRPQMMRQASQGQRRCSILTHVFVRGKDTVYCSEREHEFYLVTHIKIYNSCYK